MKKKKPNFLHYLSFIVVVLTLCASIMAASKYIFLMSAKSYEDCGIIEFAAAEWYTKTESVRRQGGVPAHTRYNYYVRYAAINSGETSYVYRERETSYEKAVAAVNSKTKIKRRVLSDGDNYITIPAEQTKTQWFNKTKIRYFVVFFCSIAYLVGFIVFMIRKKLRR